jgi:hypothetical protein
MSCVSAVYLTSNLFVLKHSDTIEQARPAGAGPVPVTEPPRAPQPEAPIDPVECRLCLLDHIDHFQTQIDTRLTMLEEQVAGWCSSFLAVILYLVNCVSKITNLLTVFLD